jgi:hypothetical protein
MPAAMPGTACSNSQTKSPQSQPEAGHLRSKINAVGIKAIQPKNIML